MERSPHLLLVDDELTIGHVVQHLARRSGHELTHCRDADSTLQYLTQTEQLPDVVLLDVKLPGISGLELHQQLLSSGSFDTLRFALFSQLTLPEVLVQALDQGIDFLVSKELISQPKQWEERIVDVLRCPSEPEIPSGGSEDWGQAKEIGFAELQTEIERAPRHPVFRELGLEVVEAVIRHSLRAALGILNPDITITKLSDVTWSLVGLPLRNKTITERERANVIVACFLYQVRALLGERATLSISNHLRQLFH